MATHDHAEHEKRISLLEAGVQQLVGGFNRMENKIDEMAAFLRTIVTLEQTTKQNSVEIDRALTRIEKVEDEVKKTDKSLHEWVNRAKGAWGATSLIGGIAQIIVIGALSFGATQLLSLRDKVTVLETKIEQLQNLKR